MSGGFVKVYQSILTSSVWMESDATLRVFLTMLTLADPNGYVAASVPGLAHVARVSRENCEAALVVLTSPDVDSRTKDHDGRRVEAVEGGWVVLNARKYRDLRTSDAQTGAERVRKHREKNKPVTPVTLQAVTDVTKKRSVTKKRTEGEGEEKKERSKAKTKAVAVAPRDAVFEEAWAVYPKRPGNNKHEAWTQWLRRVAEGADALDLLESTRRYASYVEGRDWPDRRMVLMARTFYGKTRRFADDWGDPEPNGEIVDAFGCLTPYGEKVTRPVKYA